MSVPSDVLGLVATSLAIPLAWTHHLRSDRPSSLISLYLTAYMLLLAARTRTLWLMGGSGVDTAIAISFNLSLSIVVLALESIESKSGIDRMQRRHSPEVFSGLWTRTLFVWLAAIFRAGYARIITLDDLPDLDTKLQSRLLHSQLSTTLSKCKSMTLIFRR